MCRGTSKLFSTWGLGLLLLLFQSGALAHGHDDPASGLDSCEICFHAQQTDDLVFPPTLPVQARPAALAFTLLYRSPHIPTAGFSHTARAPPVSL